MRVKREVPVERIEVFPDGRAVIWLAGGDGVEVHLPEKVMSAIVNALAAKVEVITDDREA